MHSSYPHTYPFALLGKIKQFQNFFWGILFHINTGLKEWTSLETNQSSRNQIIMYIQTERLYFSHMS